MKIYIHPCKKLECTYCGSGPDEDCKRKDGTHVPFHARRWRRWESQQNLVNRQKRFLRKNPSKFVLISVHDNYNDAESVMHSINSFGDHDWPSDEYMATAIPDDDDILSWNVWIGNKERMIRFYEQ